MSSTASAVPVTATATSGGCPDYLNTNNASAVSYTTKLAWYKVCFSNGTKAGNNIIDAIPCTPGYSDLWSAQNITITNLSLPYNYYKDVATIFADSSAGKIALANLNTYVNCPVVTFGSTCVDDSPDPKPKPPAPTYGWFKGQQVFHFCFPAIIVNGTAEALLAMTINQNVWHIYANNTNDTAEGYGVFDVVLGTPFWDLKNVTVPKNLAGANTIRSAAEILAGGYAVAETGMVVNCPIAYVEVRSFNSIQCEARDKWLDLWDTYLTAKRQRRVRNSRDAFDDLGTHQPPDERYYVEVLGEILGKVGWQENMKDGKIWRRWIEESDVELEPEEATYLRQELEHIAEHHVVCLNRPTGALISPFSAHGVYVSNTILDADLARVFRERLQPAQDVAVLAERWHPRSSHQVLDVLHPTPYCLVYGRTLSSSEPTPLVGDKATIAPPNDQFYVNENGGVTLRSPIHNLRLNSENAPLYRSIAAALRRMVPMFERCVDTYPRNRIPNQDSDLAPQKLEEFIAVNMPARGDDGEVDEELLERERARLRRQWRRTIRMPSMPREFDPKDGLAEEEVVSLRGRSVQVIFKVSSVHLTPENPEYKGTAWHLEGMRNEATIATGLYYETLDNITESRLSFREEYDPTKFEYDQDVHEPLFHAYGIRDHDIARVDWAEEEVEAAFRGRLPTVCARRIVAEWVREGCVFKKEESRKLEEELMDERTAAVEHSKHHRISLC
ncbi:hypothetical protein HK101_001888 [Irineochytrium annulatum]|nr:hypothetical protein HK101_001888 [Irineochytrium annulatum]